MQSDIVARFRRRSAFGLCFEFAQLLPEQNVVWANINYVLYTKERTREWVFNLSAPFKIKAMIFYLPRHLHSDADQQIELSILHLGWI